MVLPRLSWGIVETGAQDAYWEFDDKVLPSFSDGLQGVVFCAKKDNASRFKKVNGQQSISHLYRVERGRLHPLRAMVL